MEKCEPVNENLILPSGCFLVKVNLSKRFLSFIQNESGKNSAINDSDENSSLLDESDVISNSDETKSISSELTMDILPESTRFTTSVALNSLKDLDEYSSSAGNFGEFDLDDDDDEEGFDADKLAQVTVYVQKNSRLKMILLSTEILKDKYTVEKTIGIVKIN